MEILIIRHGDAVDEAPGLGDAGRWLTGKGRLVTRKVAHFLMSRDDTRPIDVWTSPLVRAVQTAEIIAEIAGLTDGVSVLRDLSTAGEVREVLRHLSRYPSEGPIALVGHEPSLSELAVTLLASKQWPGFKKSGVAALSWSGKGKASFRFLLEPGEMKLRTEL